MGCGLLVGGRMTFPSLTVRENLRLAAFSFRKDRARASAAIDEALDAFPALDARLDQPGGDALRRRATDARARARAARHDPACS